MGDTTDKDYNNFKNCNQACVSANILKFALAAVALAMFALFWEKNSILDIAIYIFVLKNWAFIYFEFVFYFKVDSSS